MIEDGAAILGSTLILTGLWWVYEPLALLVGGGGLLYVAWRAARRRGGR